MPTTAGGRWYPGGRTQVYEAAPLRLAGTWAEPTIDGPGTIAADGFEYAIPAMCDVKVVTARGRSILHVRSEGRVAVLAEGLQLVEADQLAKSRAYPSNWFAVHGDKSSAT
ncbi:hypothetical protein BH09ACT4_BH09ACT4_03930 [soil metagenome]